ncbi:MAG: hypothetical protein AAF348_15615 [Bacteroidota bacterium]
MRRLHLFEFGDLKNCPTIFKNYLTDFLQFCATRFKLYDDLIPVLNEALLKSGKNTIIDIGSGGGGGMLTIYNKLKTSVPELDILLTDINPNLSAFDRIHVITDGKIAYFKEPVDATNIPEGLDGFRTMFKCFHHFRPETAKKILQDCINKNKPIGIFEGQERSFWYTLYFFLINPVLILLVTPFIRPFKWGRLVFTYFVPVMPLIICWDATVSCLRTYEPEDLKNTISSLKNHDTFHWEINKIRKNHRIVLYLVGYPKALEEISI